MTNKEAKFPNVKCKNCGWIHFQVSKSYVMDWLEGWKKFWPTLTEEGKSNYGLSDGPPGPEEYTKCQRCGGNYKNFTDATEKDLARIYGSTVSGVLDRNEDLD